MNIILDEVTILKAINETSGGSNYRKSLLKDFILYRVESQLKNICEAVEDLIFYNCQGYVWECEGTNINGETYNCSIGFVLDEDDSTGFCSEKVNDFLKPNILRSICEFSSRRSKDIGDINIDMGLLVILLKDFILCMENYLFSLLYEHFRVYGRYYIKSRASIDDVVILKIYSGENINESNVHQ